MGDKNNDVSLILTKAKKQGFLPDVKDEEVDILTAESKKIFGTDSGFTTRQNLPLRASGERFRNITVLIYHLVNAGTFSTDLDFVQEWNYTTVTLKDVWEHLEGISTLPDKPILITFDDGIPSQYTAAQELYNRADREAIIFLAVQGNGSPSGSAWFDDISVKVENLPSTLSV